jgi:2-iminobutanoate/2-iminopropanoate deaminase
MPHVHTVRKISAANAPKANGPYSHAIEAGPFVFVSGQLAVDPSTNNLIQGDIKTQTRQIFKNIETILKEAGMDLTYIVKVTVLLKDINDFAAMNEAYAEVLGDTAPARSAFQVAALPRGGSIEIEVMAFRRDM